VREEGRAELGIGAAHAGGVKLALALVVALSGCAVAFDYDEGQDADPADMEKADLASQSCETVACGNDNADVILFPGNPACPNGGCERGLASDDIYIPPRSGRPWGDTYEQGVAPARVLAGYSSGRIALLRRLALVNDGQHAIMLDPSWVDGPRDFLGQGPMNAEDIVRTWLRQDPTRMFTIIYSTRSAGYGVYRGLRDDAQVGARVRVCTVSEPHLLVPTVRDLKKALVDPLSWDNGTCRLGPGG
jgi:hypothetical protein